MAALAARFAAQAGETATVIKAFLVRQAWTELAGPCHSLAGRAGMFGHADVGDAARAVEEAIDAGGAPDEIAQLTTVLLDRLRALRQSR